MTHLLLLGRIAAPSLPRPRAPSHHPAARIGTTLRAGAAGRLQKVAQSSIIRVRFS
jgi:hypothetical protein